MWHIEFFTVAMLILFAVALLWYIISDIWDKQLPYQCQKILKEYDQLKQENKELKNENEKLKKESSQYKTNSSKSTESN